MFFMLMDRLRLMDWSGETLLGLEQVSYGPQVTVVESFVLFCIVVCSGWYCFYLKR